MGYGDARPLYPSKRYENWDLPDPAGRELDEVRTVLDQVRRRVKPFSP